MLTRIDPSLTKPNRGSSKSRHRDPFDSRGREISSQNLKIPQKLNNPFPPASLVASKNGNDWLTVFNNQELPSHINPCCNSL